MSALIKKEIRLLLPAWIVAMALAVAPSTIGFIEGAFDITVTYSGTFYSTFVLCIFISFGFGVLYLGIASFGQELNSGSLGFLLAQPMERRKIWLVKIITLAAALASVWLAAFALLSWQFHVLMLIPNAFHGMVLDSYWKGIVPFLALSTLVSFSGGLWTTLLLRQTTAAFWFTLLTPLAIILGILMVFNDRIDLGESVGSIIVAALLIYSAAGFLAASWLFLRAQDLQWTGGEISFPRRQVISKGRTVSSSIGPRHWLSALAWKEIQLHQVNLLIAAFILALHLFCVFVRTIHPHFNDPDLQFILESFWLLWLLMPLLIGCAAVAEERRSGVMESQLCLPVSRRVQLFIKFSAGLVLSLLLAGALPLLIEGTKIAVGNWVFAMAGAIFFISFYASSLSRTTLQAIGWAAVLGIFLFYEARATSDPLYPHYLYQHYFPASNPAGYALLTLGIAVPVLVAAFGWLAYWNFKWLHSPKKLWLRNITVLFATAVSISILTNAIYFRAWEFLTPIGPSVGPARVSSSSELKFSCTPDSICARLPDGRLRVETLAYNLISNRWQGKFSLLAPQRGQAEFVGDSNWVDAAEDVYQMVGIKGNGTLWSMQRKWDASRLRWEQSGTFMPAQIGTDTDWAQAAARPNGFLLLKRDGSLWCWGADNITRRHYRDPFSQKLEADRLKTPVRLSEETDWAEVFTSGFEAFAKRNDGSLWNWAGYVSNKGALISPILDTNLNSQWSDVSFGPGGTFFVGVKTNGELWFVEQFEMGRETHIEKYQIGKGMKWKAALLEPENKIAAIRDDGTLWRFVPPRGYGNISYSVPTEPVQLGNDSCWVSLLDTHRGNPGFFAVASDGSIWLWDQESHHVWLNPSRKPIYAGNIFGDTIAAQ